MDVPEVSVNVASLLQPFVLRDVSIGLSGERPVFCRWLQELNTLAPYSEDAFNWKVAELLPCPRSFFTLVYERDGNLRIIFGAHSESIEASDSGAEGYCECCYARITPYSRRILHAGEYGTGDSTNPTGWSGNNEFCMVCYDTKAYENFWNYDENADVLKHLSTYEHEYLDRLEELYEQLE